MSQDIKDKMTNNIDKYVSNYFFIAKKIISSKLPNKKVYMQFFQRHNDVKLCGINEVLELLEKYSDTSKYQIKYLEEGKIINNLEPVLTLEGNYADFGVYEGVIDGILARSTSIATNAYHCLKAANKKTIIYMGDRADHYINQERDGYAVEIGGISGHSSLAGSRGDKDVLFGSIPHVLLQHYQGNCVAAMLAYAELLPEDQDLVALVDYNNDVIKDSLAVLKALGKKLKGVRVDTSKNMVDHMFDNEEPHYGVNIEQIKRLRRALDENNGSHVRIIASSGFNVEKIKEFEAAQTPVDAYGIGEFILNINIHFSADAVLLDGKKEAKEGRYFIENKNLKLYQGNKK